MRNKMWEFSSVVTVTLGILMSEAAASVIAGHSAADLSWKQESNYGGRKTVKGRMGKTENLTQDTKKGTRPQWTWPQTPQAHVYLSLVGGVFSSLHREVGKP